MTKNMIVLFVDCVITQINYLDPIYLRGVKTCRQVNCSRHLFFAMWKEPYLEKNIVVGKSAVCHAYMTVVSEINGTVLVEIGVPADVLFQGRMMWV